MTLELAESHILTKACCKGWSQESDLFLEGTLFLEDAENLSNRI